RSFIMLFRSGFAAAAVAVCSSLLATTASAVDITGVLQVPNKLESDGGGLERIFGRSRVILEDGREYGANVDQRGIFRIPDVELGTYVLQVVNQDIEFEQFTIDVLPDNKVTAHHFDTLHSHGKISSKGLPLVISARGRIEYFTQRESFNLLHVLKSPMAIMALVMAGIMLCLPKLQQNMMDEETMKEMKEVAANDDGLTGGLMRAMTGGGAAASDTSAVPAAAAAAPKNTKKEGGNARRRGGHRG
ncbi:hypothetical protein FOZ63_008450, partial [Perkinsus olseni]